MLREEGVKCGIGMGRWYRLDDMERSWGRVEVMLKLMA